MEGRPAEQGRCVIVEQRGNESIDILPSEYNARSKIHEYGGGACNASPDGSLIFADANTSGVFRLKSAYDAQPIINASEQFRYADFDVHPLKTNLILAVQEDHSGKTVENRVALINADNKSVTIICQGADFYCAPRFNHDGTKICWVQWNHPDMPWTGSELYVADWNGVGPLNVKHIAGKAVGEAVGQPRWHEDGTLFFTSDKTGFAQLYRLDSSSLEILPLVLPGWEEADIASKQVLSGLGKYVSDSWTRKSLTGPQQFVHYLDSYPTCSRIYEECYRWIVTGRSPNFESSRAPTWPGRHSYELHSQNLQH